MNAFRSRWSNFWFGTQEPINLAWCRILFFGLLAIFYAPLEPGAWGDVSRVCWFPVSFFKFFHLPVLSARALTMVGLGWKLALVASACGAATRISTLTALVGGLYLLGLPQNFGKVHHFDAPVVVIFGIMAFARCGDAYSVDRWLGRDRGKPSAGPSPEYRWPVRAVWLTLALVFGAAGVAKLRHGGLAWITSDNMAILFLQHAYHVANRDPLTDWGVRLAQVPLACRIIALATVVVELGYPLSLVSARARWFFPAAMVFTLLGIRLLMGPTFMQLMICNVFWIPWDRVASKVRRPASGRPEIA